MRLAEAAPKAQRPGGVPFSPSASKRAPKQSKDVKDLKELKAALQGLQAAGPRAGLAVRPKAKKEHEGGKSMSEKELRLDVRFDSAGEVRLRASGAGVDFRAAALGGLWEPEAKLDVHWEEEDSLPAEVSALDQGLPLSMGEALSSLTLGLNEEEVDCWDEEDDMEVVPPIGLKGLNRLQMEEEAALRKEEEEARQEASRTEQICREFACHFVKAVIDSTLIQAVTGHRHLVTPRRAAPTMGPNSVQASPARKPPAPVFLEMDTAHLEAAGMAEMEQRLEAALDLQLSAPSSPCGPVRLLAPLAPPSPPLPAGDDWEALELEVGLRLQLAVPPLPCPAPAPSALQQRAGNVEPIAVQGSPRIARQTSSRCGLRPSKSHRRIIGGVIRTPLAESEHGAVCHSIDRAAAAVAPLAPRQLVLCEEPEEAAAASSRAGAAKASKSTRQGRDGPSGGAGHRGATVVFRMDFDEPSLMASPHEGNAAARGSSLAGRYEALGAELFSMQDEADYTQATYGDMRRHGSSLARGQGASAMSLDLGESAGRSSSFARPATPAAPSQHQTTKCLQRSPSAVVVKPGRAGAIQRAASPAGSQAPPKKQQGLLPELPSTTCSGSLAWTRRLHRPASRGSLAGRGALDAAF